MWQVSSARAAPHIHTLTHTFTHTLTHTLTTHTTQRARAHTHTHTHTHNAQRTHTHTQFGEDGVEAAPAWPAARRLVLWFVAAGT
jgi:hypothetical protein